MGILSEISGTRVYLDTSPFIVDEHGFDDVMRGLLAAKPKTEEKNKSRKKKVKTLKK